jgi:hypothetical protein
MESIVVVQTLSPDQASTEAGREPILRGLQPFAADSEMLLQRAAQQGSKDR